MHSSTKLRVSGGERLEQIIPYYVYNSNSFSLLFLWRPAPTATHLCYRSCVNKIMREREERKAVFMFCMFCTKV